MWYIWLIAAGVFFAVEVMTVGFLVFWLGVAALITCIVSLFTANLIVQTSVFVVLSGLLIFFTKPLVDKFAGNKEPGVKTNAYSIIGKDGIVTSSFDSSSKVGQIQVGSEKWTAISQNSDILSEGDKVKVEAIDGVKAIVSKI